MNTLTDQQLSDVMDECGRLYHLCSAVQLEKIKSRLVRHAKHAKKCMVDAGNARATMSTTDRQRVQKANDKFSEASIRFQIKSIHIDYVNGQIEQHKKHEADQKPGRPSMDALFDGSDAHLLVD